MTARATEKDGIVAEVREKYGRIAKGGGSCCGPSACCGAEGVPLSFGVGYRKDEIEALPEGADLGLGCGAPIAHLALRAGETVLDLGSGGGIDAFLAAREVGSGGRVIGVDMTPEMIARVLKPGGRLVISDVVLDGRLPESVEKDVYAYVGCVAGAALRGHYFGQLRDAGLGSPEILKDVDFLAGLKDAAPEEAEGLLQRTGVSWKDVAGKVRSITFRARKAS